MTLRHGMIAPVLATLVGIASAVLGVWLTGVERRSRLVVPFSAGVLLGVALFGLLPELAIEKGWAVSLLLFPLGTSLLLAAAVSVPCNVPVPVARAAVTTRPFVVMKFPAESSVRITGCCANSTPAVAVDDG